MNTVYETFLNERELARILQVGKPELVVRQLLDSCLCLYPTQAGLAMVCEDPLQSNDYQALDRVVVSVFDYVEDLSRRAHILRFFSAAARRYRASLDTFHIHTAPDGSDREVPLEIGEEKARLLQGFLTDPAFQGIEPACFLRDIVHRHLGLLPDFLPEELLDGAPRLLLDVFREFLSESLIRLFQVVLLQFYTQQSGFSLPGREAGEHILALGRFFTEFGTANWKLQQRKRARSRR
ncbi:hypothetical protein CLOSTMETH_03298 [[Clostridium] methylpentosum DSM 5476]|uniref:Uncharacterized protein n=1 Tax=[Clostridium] methylpentosum DSM 5476 TaxID=537013 RepID=C0EH98_9FIRM|nr:hypothetical protein CLOSTMETH_03298 [[Clostridium] methylpentosum DSM 5476]MDY3987897.1 hypothetical protein [Massilioclostridium sp.]MEE1490443.1 hypothetical protein [Massilioclostridium sp.]